MSYSFCTSARSWNHLWLLQQLKWKQRLTLTCNAMRRNVTVVNIVYFSRLQVHKWTKYTRLWFIGVFVTKILHIVPWNLVIKFIFLNSNFYSNLILIQVATYIVFNCLKTNLTLSIRPLINYSDSVAQGPTFKAYPDIVPFPPLLNDPLPVGNHFLCHFNDTS